MKMANKNQYRAYLNRIIQLHLVPLVEALTNDIHPRALLDECINRGIIRFAEDYMGHLIAESLISVDDIDEKSHFFGQIIHDHISAPVHNLNSGQPALLDRFIWHED